MKPAPRTELPTTTTRRTGEPPARPSLLASRSLFTHSRNRYLDPRWDRYRERAMAYERSSVYSSSF